MMRKAICTIGNILFLLKRKNIPINPKKILIIRSGAIGDVLMTTPFLKAIRKRFPNSEIHYLVGEWSKKILEGNKNIDKLISFDDKIVYNKKIFGTINLIKKMRKERYSLCFILDKSYYWGIIGFLFGIKARIGFDRLGEGFANNINVQFNGTKYELDYNLELAEKAGADIKDKKMEIQLDKEDISFADDFIATNKIKGKIIGISAGGAKNPGQTMDVKRWPVEKYVELIKKISKKYIVFLFGGSSDKEISDKIINAAGTRNIYDLTGKTTIKQSAALMRKCFLFVTHDSGPMHIAAAMGVKVIALFGPTPSQRFAPRDAVVIKSSREGCPCYDVYGNYKKCRNKECMNSINVEEVYKEVIHLC